MKAYTRVLTIAGSDSGGGAGIQADLKTISALDCFGMSAITALTAQNTCGVTGIHPVPSDFVRAQIQAIFDDMGADAVKIGMLYSAELIKSVAESLKALHAGPVVLDPVMVAQSGDPLLQPDAVSAIRDHLLPHVTIATPNLPEAEILCEKKLASGAEIISAGQTLCKTYRTAILIKGGHSTGEESTDLLFMPETDNPIRFTSKRLKTANNHGTGCTLSAAIAALLAKGATLPDAVESAKAYLTEALEAGRTYRLGNGAGPVHHFYKWWS